MHATLIPLRFCAVEFTDWGCVTRFLDGSQAPSIPHDIHHYHVIAHRLGYADDVMSFCREHDFAHAFLEQELHDRPSAVLWAAAHGKPLTGPESAYEEASVQMLQAWMRANAQPIIAGVDWLRLKRDALELLG